MAEKMGAEALEAAARAVLHRRIKPDFFEVKDGSWTLDHDKVVAEAAITAYLAALSNHIPDIGQMVPGFTGSAEGWVLVPREPSDGLLMSMAIRRDHGLGMPGYYDMCGVGEHEKRLRVAISEARQAHEEVVGAGFHSKERDAAYRTMIDAAGGRDE